MNLYRRLIVPSFAALLTITATAFIAGCGSGGSTQAQIPTPTPTPIPSTPAPTPTPTPVPTPGPTPTPTPTPTPSAASITGTVVDPSGVPVVGTVTVALESGLGDFSITKLVNADAQGKFTFANVPPPPTSEGYAIMVAARAAHDPGTAPGAPGSFYTPALLLPGGGLFGPGGNPIVPGTNVGTIKLRFTSQGDIEGNVTSTDSTQKVPVPVHVTFGPLGIFTRDFIFDYPMISPPAPFNTGAGLSCPAGTACGSYQLPVVPTDPVEEAVFSTTGYTFGPSQSPPTFTIRLHASSVANGQPTCNTPDLAVTTDTLKSDSPNQAGTAQFQGCQ